DPRRPAKEVAMNVQAVMSPRVAWVHPSLPVREAARRMRGLNVGCLPVGENGKLLGVITDRDIVCRSVADALDPDSLHVYDVMTAGAACCFADQDGEAAAEIMRRKRVRRLPVLDRREHLVGLVSLDDLCGRIPDAVFVSTLEAITRGDHDGAEPGPAAARS
ncbi:MAG: CBS domain-containing protein, partial [Rhodospirillales bacterium]|nr:CBS domain-containing protein [Rhodospirillales bacterium]